MRVIGIKEIDQSKGDQRIGDHFVPEPCFSDLFALLEKETHLRHSVRDVVMEDRFASNTGIQSVKWLEVSPYI